MTKPIDPVTGKPLHGKSGEHGKDKPHGKPVDPVTGLPLHGPGSPGYVPDADEEGETETDPATPPVPPVP